MKRLTSKLLLLPILLSAICLKAQVTDTIIDGNTDSTYVYQSFFGNDSTRINIYDSHIIDAAWTHVTSIYNSDTVNINGILYYKTTGDAYDPYTGIYYREDRDTGRLYQYVERNDSNVGDIKVEVLICDMSLNVGDTFHFPHEDDYDTDHYYGHRTSVVTDVRYENGKKIIVFDDDWNLDIYNMGAPALTFREGEFPVVVPTVDLREYNELLCQFKDGEQTCHNPGYEECYYDWISVEEIESKNVTIIPTFFSSGETISIKSDSDIKDIKMIDMLGRDVKVSINPTDDFSCEMSLNQKCNSGIYLIIVETEKGVRYEKVVLR